MTTQTRNGAVLTAQTATIQTAQVEIRVLKVGKKQVTMGLFRQLPLRNITTYPTVELKGEPWGHVNYWWDGDGRQYPFDADDGLHLVWQDGDCLCRDIVCEGPRTQYLHYYAQAEDAAQAVAYVVLSGHATARERLSGRDRDQHRFTYDDSCYTLLSPADSAIANIADRWWGQRREDIETLVAGEADYAQKYCPGRVEAYLDERRRHYQHVYAQAQRGYQALLTQWQISTLSVADAWRAVEQADAQRKQYIDAWAAQWAALAALPQLFIAV